ncbi:MAG: ribbon-helix-helix protein, CopG family [Armatimonadota bacterium]
MVRTQIQLTEEQAGRLKRMAAMQNTSMAEVIRRLIDEKLGEGEELTREERVRRFLALAGSGRSGLTDISQRHDDYLAEDYVS